MHHATSPESHKAALQALRAEVEQLQAEKRESKGDATPSEASGDQDECSEDAEGEHQRRVATLWQKAKEVAFAAGGGGVRVGRHGMTGMVLGEYLQVVE